MIRINQTFVLKYASTNVRVAISGLCKLTVIAEKSEIQLSQHVVTKMCSSLILCSKIHEISVLHAWECDAMSRNVVKRLAIQNRVNCLLDMIGQSDMLSLYGTEIRICLGHRELSGTKKTRRC